MKAKIDRRGYIRVTGIYNESFLERLQRMVDDSGVKVTYKDNLTKAVISGSNAELNRFIEIWNDGGY
jgi:hypothetical protein